MYTGRKTRFDNPFGEHFFVVTINFRKLHKLGTLFLGKKDARHFLSAIHSICIHIPHTYTYDQFTAFFYEGRVYLSDTNYPIGQCCVDVMNMDEEVLDEIDRRVEKFIPAAWALLSKKTNSAVCRSLIRK